MTLDRETIEWQEDELGPATSHQWVGEGPDWYGVGIPYVD